MPDDGEQVAAYAAAGRLYQAQGRVRGDCGIDCAAAAFQYVERNLGGQRLAGRRHAVLRNNFRTGRKRLSCPAIVAAGRHGQTSHRDQDGQAQCVVHAYLRIHAGKR